MNPVPDPAPVARPTVIRCPRCGIEMTTYERSGVMLDQCRDCRGFFLDSGELERLVAAEGGAWLGPTPRQAATPHPNPSPGGRGQAGGPPSAPRMASVGFPYHSEWSVSEPDVAQGGGRRPPVAAGR